MRILQNTKREKELFAKVKEALEAGRHGIHASDLLSPRLAYFRKMFPVELSANEVGYFATGHGHHMFLVHLGTGNKGISEEESLYSKEYGIHYSPDLSKEQVEFKTARFHKEPTTEKQCIKDFSRYTQQALVYAICEGVDKWNLYLLYIGLRKVDPEGKMLTGLKAPKLKCYTVHFTEEEVQDGKQWIKSTVALLSTAIEKKSHKGLPLCEEWQCIRWDPETKRKEIQCPYFKTKCKPKGRYDEWLEHYRNKEDE